MLEEALIAAIALGVVTCPGELCTILFLNDTAISNSINMEDFSQMLLNDSFSLFVISDSIDFLLFPSLWFQLITLATAIAMIALDTVWDSWDGIWIEMVWFWEKCLWEPDISVGWPPVHFVETFLCLFFIVSFYYAFLLNIYYESAFRSLCAYKQLCLLSFPCSLREEESIIWIMCYVFSIVQARNTVNNETKADISAWCLF